MHQFEKVENPPSLCKFDNSLVWKTRRQLCESGGGRPGLPVPNSPKALCGRKATLNELLSRAYDGDSAQRSCKLHCSSAMTISVGLALSCGRVRLRDFWGCTSGGVNDEVNATCIYSPALRVSVGNSGLCCCTAVFVWCLWSANTSLSVDSKRHLFGSSDSLPVHLSVPVLPSCAQHALNSLHTMSTFLTGRPHSW